METSSLFPCPDCQHQCSTHAEACPACGRFFRGYSRIVEVIPGRGWSMVIFWGIVLAWLLPALLVIGLVVVLIAIGGAALPHR